MERAHSRKKRQTEVRKLATEQEWTEELRVGQSRILEMIATGSPLTETLNCLARLIEAQVDGMLCSVLLLDADGKRLRLGAAPSLPEGFNRAVDGFAIGPGAASCGTAAYLRQPVVATDISSDPLWENVRDIPARYGLRACWSTPIVSHQGRLLGTFAMYYREPRSPGPVEMRLVGVATHLAAIAIERTQSEQELRRTVSVLQSTIDSTADGILLVDNDGRMVLFNSRFSAIWQIPQAILESRDNAAALNHVLGQLKDPELFLRRVKEIYAAPESESFDVIEFKDGRFVERYSIPQRQDGVTVGRVASFRDVTESKRLEEQFRQSQKMEAFGQLAAGVAHDFNNILTVIMGNLSLLKEGGLAKAEEASMLGQVLEASERGASLTRQLLTFSRRQPMRPHDMDLNDVVRNMTEMLHHVLGEHVELEARYHCEHAPVHADPGMMEQILVNLAVNSRDAMPKGGRLILETAMVVMGADRSKARPDAPSGEFVRLGVTDTGTGIKAEHLPHIFEPFFTTKDVGMGTGLGLATVFGIVKQHHGWVDVESRLGEGTTFHIYLPRLSKPMAPKDGPKPRSEAKGGSETILLVEDEAAVRSMMAAFLKRHGYRIHEAANGMEALKCWEENRSNIDLLLTDMVMPEGFGGRELADCLRAERPDLKVIYCSGYTDEVLGEDSPLRNNRYFLRKPFDPQLLLTMVRDCLDGL